ncbi:caspase-8 isoform X2 [Kryptolebias marmoratus]|uniref:Caspase-8 n=1 Tax=Kryptolebias marmoratus TaxID=37003 RepID=A0A3Q3AZ56_KRYMA|nr:caspase-8 isoform X2 [Kryptolebias marmoratus]
MDFQKLLLDVGKGLGQDELRALTFLCADLLRRNPNSVETFSDLFSCLMDRDVLSAERPQLLTELLTTIQQPRLLRDLRLNERITTNYISSYRKLLYSLSEDITSEDLQSIKFLLNRLVPRRKLAENSTTLDVFLEMEHLELISETNLDKLESMFNAVCPVLNQKIAKYKARPVQEVNLSEAVRPVSPASLCSMNSTDAVVAGPTPGQNVGPRDLIKMTKIDPDPDPKAAKHFGDLGTYPMNAAKRGICVILNNEDFSKSGSNLGNRVGTIPDENALRGVFEWLGFEVQVHRNLGKRPMLSVLQKLSKEDYKQMDCLVCCVLSHGEEGTVYGVDGCTVTIKELMAPFNGMRCPSLVEKPKLFFIQACQGTDYQKAVETDSRKKEEEDDNICSDARVAESIPSNADFLLGMATVPSYVSFRDRNNGTWYIQSLCQNLTKMVPMGTDLVSILTKVNADVSKKSDSFGWRKQMPQPSFSLRKRVIFPIPTGPPPAFGAI